MFPSPVLKQVPLSPKQTLVTYRSISVDFVAGRPHSQTKEDSESVPALEQNHAPRFVDSQQRLGEGAAVASPEAFTASTSTAAAKLSKDASKAKQKDANKTAKRQLDALCSQLGPHLHSNGWAVCDGFASEDLVRRVRDEATLFKVLTQVTRIHPLK